MEIFCNNVIAFTVIFDQLNASWQNNGIRF